MDFTQTWLPFHDVVFANYLHVFVAGMNATRRIGASWNYEMVAPTVLEAFCLLGGHGDSKM